MNEDITEEIYYCLIKAGYEQKKASRLCNDPHINNLLKDYKQKALEEARSKFIEFLIKYIEYIN